jgi:hypothetical protein
MTVEELLIALQGWNSDLTVKKDNDGVFANDVDAVEFRDDNGEYILLT